MSVYNSMITLIIKIIRCIEFMVQETKEQRMEVAMKHFDYLR